MRHKPSGRCGRKCPGGNACCCTDEFKEHKFHICKFAECFCHSKDRYDAQSRERVAQARRVEVSA